MPKVASTTDGLWTQAFPAGSQPSASLGASIRHRIILPAMSSAAICSSILFVASGTLQGELIASGPKSFLTVGAVKYRLGEASCIEHVAAGTDLPKGGAR